MAFLKRGKGKILEVGDFGVENNKLKFIKRRDNRRKEKKERRKRKEVKRGE